MDNNIFKNPIISEYTNNDFLIIPFDKITAVNINENDGEEYFRLHLDILKNKEEK